MELALDIVTTVLLGLGCLVSLTGAVGVLRLPDFYARGHAAGMTDSLAQVLFMTALLLQVWRYPELVMNAGPRLIFISLFIMFTSPIATHAITRAAYRHGQKPWTRQDGDRD